MALMYLTDIDERKSSFQLRYESEFDQLTDVYNKSAETKIMQSAQANGGFACLSDSDLDNFKEINDSFDIRQGMKS
ncbi:MAG: GGDEF domain-containing protein [[Clostridium] innocuum]